MNTQAAESGSNSNCRGRRRQCLCLISAFMSLLSSCANVHSAAIANDLFELYEIDTGNARQQTVIPGFFLGDTISEIVVVHLDESNQRKLQMFGLEGDNWLGLLDATLDPGVLFLDVVSGGGRDRLITYTSGQLNWFDPDSATESPLMNIEIDFHATDGERIPHLDITRDLNGDGRDDLVVPNINGFWISIQLSDGSFTNPLQLGPPEPFRDAPGLVGSGIDRSRSYAEVGITELTLPLYLSRVYEVDFNRDGRGDLIFWNEDHFDIYYQDQRRQFDPVPETFTVDVPFDADGAYTLMYALNDESTFSFISGLRENSKQTVLHLLQDLNGDQVADIATLSLEGRSFFSRRSRYEVHFGMLTPEGIVFSQEVSTTIHRRGMAAGIQPWGYSSEKIQDFNSDGLVDIMFSDIRMGIGGISRALLANSVAMDLEFYEFENGVYPDQPTASFDIRPDLRPLAGRKAIFFPVALMGDVNGDSRSELIVAQSRQELQVYLGTEDSDLFVREPLILSVPLPADQLANVRMVDLNMDDKQDLIIKHPSSTEPHRLNILIANPIDQE